MPTGTRGIPSSESRSRFSKLYSGLQSQLILRSRLINTGIVNEPTLWELIGHNFPTDGFLDGPLRTVREREEWKRKVSSGAMSLPDNPFSPQLVGDASTLSASAPLPQPDDLKAVLDAEKASHATILNIIGDCERQLNQLSALHSPQDPAIRDLRYTLSLALLEARQSKNRQATLRTQLRLASGHRRSGLGPALDRFLEARDETLAMELAASAHILDSIANGARFVVRQVMSLYEGTMGQGARIGRAWSEVWEPLGVDLVAEEGEGQGNLQECNGEAQKAEEKIDEKE